AAPPGRAAPPRGRRPGRAPGTSPGRPRPPARRRPSQAGSCPEHIAGLPGETCGGFVVVAGSRWQDTEPIGPPSRGKVGPVAEPALLISTDPFLGANLEAAAHGRVQVAHLDPA